MSAADVALGCRSIILACLMMTAALAIVNAWSYSRKHRLPQDRRGRRLAALKALSVSVYGVGAFAGTWLRLDMEFSWSLPPMALGLTMYVAYLWCHGEGEPVPKASVDDREVTPPLGIRP